MCMLILGTNMFAVCGVQTSVSTQEVQGLSCCSFSPNGELFVASSKSGTTFMWSWQILGGKNRRKGPRAKEQAAAGTADVPDSEGPYDRDNWPQPTELCVLEGHQADVSLVFFSHRGGALATASRDGQVRVRDYEILLALSEGGHMKESRVWRRLFDECNVDNEPCLLLSNARYGDHTKSKLGTLSGLRRWRLELRSLQAAAGDALRHLLLIKWHGGVMIDGC